MTSKEWKTCKLSDFMEFNPRETLAKGTIAKKIAMENLQLFCRDVCQYEYAPYNGGVKFKNGDTIMARITPCLENGKTSKINILEEDEIAFGSTESRTEIDVDKVHDETVDAIIDLIHELKEEQESFKKLNIDYEEKAFFDILVAVRDNHKFVYDDQKMIYLCREIKKIVADKTKYTDCFKRQISKPNWKLI